MSDIESYTAEDGKQVPGEGNPGSPDYFDNPGAPGYFTERHFNSRHLDAAGTKVAEQFGCDLVEGHNAVWAALPDIIEGVKKAIEREGRDNMHVSEVIELVENFGKDA